MHAYMTRLSCRHISLNFRWITFEQDAEISHVCCVCVCVCVCVSHVTMVPVCAVIEWIYQNEVIVQTYSNTPSRLSIYGVVWKLDKQYAAAILVKLTSVSCSMYRPRFPWRRTDWCNWICAFQERDNKPKKEPAIPECTYKWKACC